MSDKKTLNELLPERLGILEAANETKYRPICEAFGIPFVIGEGGGLVVPRERVAELLLDSPDAYIMCKEYGDDEDWEGIGARDIGAWEDWDNTVDGIPEWYQTFEIW